MFVTICEKCNTKNQYFTNNNVCSKCGAALSLLSSAGTVNLDVEYSPEEDTRDCPRCTMAVGINDVMCHFCGSDLPIFYNPK